MSAIRYGLSPDEVVWVEDILSKDESSGDAELISYFIRGGLSQGQAEAVMTHRQAYLRTVYLRGSGPLHIQ